MELALGTYLKLPEVRDQSGHLAREITLVEDLVGGVRYLLS